MCIPISLYTTSLPSPLKEKKNIHHIHHIHQSPLFPPSSPSFRPVFPCFSLFFPVFPRFLPFLLSFHPLPAFFHLSSISPPSLLHPSSISPPSLPRPPPISHVPEAEDAPSSPLIPSRSLRLLLFAPLLPVRSLLPASRPLPCVPFPRFPSGSPPISLRFPSLFSPLSFRFPSVFPSVLLLSSPFIPFHPPSFPLVPPHLPYTPFPLRPIHHSMHFYTPSMYFSPSICASISIFPPHLRLISRKVFYTCFPKIDVQKHSFNPC